MTLKWERYNLKFLLGASSSFLIFHCTCIVLIKQVRTLATERYGNPMFESKPKSIIVNEAVAPAAVEMPGNFDSRKINPSLLDLHHSHGSRSNMPNYNVPQQTLLYANRENGNNGIVKNGDLAADLTSKTDANSQSRLDEESAKKENYSSDSNPNSNSSYQTSSPSSSIPSPLAQEINEFSEVDTGQETQPLARKATMQMDRGFGEVLDATTESNEGGGFTTEQQKNITVTSSYIEESQTSEQPILEFGDDVNITKLQSLSQFQMVNDSNTSVGKQDESDLTVKLDDLLTIGNNVTSEEKARNQDGVLGATKSKNGARVVVHDHNLLRPSAYLKEVNELLNQPNGSIVAGLKIYYGIPENGKNDSGTNITNADGQPTCPNFLEFIAASKEFWTHITEESAATSWVNVIVEAVMKSANALGRCFEKIQEDLINFIKSLIFFD